MIEYVYIPFRRDLYDDIIRFSGGRLDPVELAEEQTLNLIERNLDGVALEWFGQDLEEFVKRQLPHCKLPENSIHPTKPWLPGSLIWKNVSVPEGSGVRMQYAGSHYYGKIVDGRIADADGQFTPSEWASKIANHTSRNAWRDLWFKKPSEKTWISAEVLRAQVQ